MGRCARPGLGMSSSNEDSDSEEELARLREAVSGAQVQSAEKARGKQRAKTSKCTVSGSGVCGSEQDGAQSFLARRLQELLDSRYDTSSAVASLPDDMKPRAVCDEGIRLLHTSKDPIVLDKATSNPGTLRRLIPSDSEESEDERLQEAAVDPHTLVPTHHKTVYRRD